MIDLNKISTEAPAGIKRSKAEKETSRLVESISERQYMLYAQSRYSLLIILQGVDLAGKGGTIRKVFSPINPMGCEVKSWKVPTEIERSYDFLWRIHQRVPPKGMIHIFDRSHYEDILVPTVDKLFPPEQIDARYNLLNNFEKLLVEEGNTVIIKFYLHISNKTQKKRLKARMADPTRQWKFDRSDTEASGRMDEYLEVYNKILNQCNDPVKWTIVPADQKWYRNYVVAKTVEEAMQGMDLAFPSLKND